MGLLTKLTGFIVFVFGPLFLKGRWVYWPLLFLIVMMMGNAITAIRMDIPNLEQVNRVAGTFVDTSKGYSRTGLYSMQIIDSSGVPHRCNCEPLGDSNCLGRKPSDHAEIRDQLDAEVLKKYTLQKAVVKWLAGKDGEIWMCPNRSWFGTSNSCYQISSNGLTLLSFEQSVQNYTEAKHGIGVYSFWFIVLWALIVSLFYLIIRISLYFAELKKT